MDSEAAFDALAARYDDAFTSRPLGRVLRQRTWARFAPLTRPAARILDIGCGTGEDAAFLAARGASVWAVDPSAAMLDVARAKVDAFGLGDRVHLARVGIEELPHWSGDGGAPFSAVVSNFGAVNCGPLDALARGLRRLTAPGADVVLVVLAPLCPWEWLWYGPRQPRRALRRLDRRGTPARVGDGALIVRYASPRTIARALQPEFELESVEGLGVVLPPTYAAHWLESRPVLLRRLDRADRRLAVLPGTRQLADHLVVRLRRVR